MKRLFVLAVLAAVLLSGCVPKEQQVVGGDRDEHGCIGSAGYQWCPSTEKCQRMWEEYCPEFADQFRITDFDSCAAAGNPVMESYPRQCRAGEKTFTEVIKVDASSFCDDAGMGAVYSCGEYTKVTSTLSGGGTTVYSPAGAEIKCPLEFVESASEDCKAFLSEECTEVCRPESRPSGTEELFPDECYARKSKIVPASEGCSEKQEQIGVIKGMQVASVCCLTTSSTDKTYCTPESKNADVCAAVYEPVCGWNNGNIIKTYSNSCFACMDANVESWAPGEC